MKKLKLILLAAIIAILGLGIYLLYGELTLKAALSVTTDPEGKTAYLNDQELGTTPVYRDDLDDGEATLKFDDFSQEINLTGGALTVVNWSLGPSAGFSGGEVVWFSHSSTGTELLVIAKPEAEVFLGGESIGSTPLSKEVQAGEYTLEIKKDGYFSRSLKIAIKDGYRLNVSAELALDPFPSGDEAEIEGGGQNIKVVDLSTSRALLLADFDLWAEGAAFYAKEDEEKNYDYFLTAEGKLYDADASEVSITSLTQQEEGIAVGYLGESGEGTTGEANTVLDQLRTALFPAPPQVLILETGVGFLRVRSGPGTNHTEIGKATPGETYEYLGEEGSWYKILFQGGEGWISSQFSQKF
jgi:hypothetical protein